MPTPTLTTARLTLRPPTAADCAHLAVILDDWSISQWIPSMPHPYGVADAERYLSMVDADDLGPTWVMVDEIGICGGISLGTELGYWVAPRVWRKGLGFEAASAVLAWHFSQAGACPVYSGYLDGNTASKGLLVKLGFGHLPGTETRVRSDAAEFPLYPVVLTPEQYHIMHPFAVQTDRFVVQSLVHRDAAELARIGGDPQVAPMIFVATVPWPEAHAASVIEGQRWRGRLGFRFGIYVRETGSLIGTVGLSPSADVFYFIDPAMWGQGVMTEVLSAFLPAAMARFDLAQIGADVFQENTASQRLLTKMGFQRVGEGIGRSAARLEPATVYLYRLARDDLKGGRR